MKKLAITEAKHGWTLLMYPVCVLFVTEGKKYEWSFDKNKK